MGKLHTLRRAIERDPSKWYRLEPYLSYQSARWDDKLKRWVPWGFNGSKSYQGFVKKVVIAIRRKLAVPRVGPADIGPGESRLGQPNDSTGKRPVDLGRNRGSIPRARSSELPDCSWMNTATAVTFRGKFDEKKPYAVWDLVIMDGMEAILLPNLCWKRISGYESIRLRDRTKIKVKL